MPELPLAGLRIVVTRPEAQAEPLATELSGLGAEVSVVPLVDIRPVDLPPVDAGAYDWIVLTSANGVAACERLLAAAGGARLAVVGPATAAAARARGLEPSFMPQRFAADAVAEGLEPLGGVRVLVAQADAADPGLVRELEARGALVDALTAYRTVELQPGDEGRSALAGADVVLLASGSAARALARAGGAGSGTLVAAIGPRTAAVAAEVGLRVGLVADEATADGIIRALMAHFGEST